MRRFPANLSHYHLSSGDMGKLYPLAIMEVLPNDSFMCASSVMVRLQPMLAPVYHGMDVRVHYWWVPNRVVWDGWEEFITGGQDGVDLGNLAHAPKLKVTTRAPGDLLDHYGLPPTSGPSSFNALPLMGYYAIWNEYYRDQDLEGEIPIDAFDMTGVSAVPETPIQYISWGKDSFTTARPWAEKGQSFEIPVVENKVDLNNIRVASSLAKFQERRARYGSRYGEYIKSEFGILPASSTMGEPEYLGGGKARMAVSEVLQTAPETGAGTPGTEYGVGDLYGHGIGAVRTRPWRRRFDEHGFIHCLLSVRPDSIYMSGANRFWMNDQIIDWYQRDMQNLGPQFVKTGELRYTGTADDQNAFGFQDRFREYRENPSYVSGNFRDTLKYWHMAREFDTTPVLGADFTRCNPTKRCFAVPSEDCLWIYSQHKIRARRVVPPYQQVKLI